MIKSMHCRKINGAHEKIVGDNFDYSPRCFNSIPGIYQLTSNSPDKLTCIFTKCQLLGEIVQLVGSTLKQVAPLRCWTRVNQGRNQARKLSAGLVHIINLIRWPRPLAKADAAGGPKPQPPQVTEFHRSRLLPWSKAFDHRSGPACRESHPRARESHPRAVAA